MIVLVIWLVVDCWRRHCMTWGWVAATGHWTSEREALCIVSVISPRLPRTGLGTLPATLLQHTLFKCKWASFRNINVRPSRHRLTPSCRAHSVGLEASTTTPPSSTLACLVLSHSHTLYSAYRPLLFVHLQPYVLRVPSYIHTYVYTYVYPSWVYNSRVLHWRIYVHIQTALYCIHRHTILKLLNLSTRLNYYYELKTVILL